MNSVKKKTGEISNIRRVVVKAKEKEIVSFPNHESFWNLKINEVSFVI